MAASPSPSSSAVTIPTPGKSILKKPPPPQQSFFSLTRLSKLLPSQNSPSLAEGNDESRALKRAHFILPEMTTVYPIHASNPPFTPTVKEEKRSIEERETERRRRVVRRNSVNPEAASPEEEWWSLEQVESFYRECCVGREEPPDQGISSAFLRARGTRPRTVDFSGVQLTAESAAVLSDVFTIEWGLRKLVFKECDLDEYIIKPILHSLTIHGTLTFLSVASNRRLKAGAFRLIGAYVTKAKDLQFLDLSQNALDKKSVEYIAQALPHAPTLGLVSLRMDDCSLKPQALDVLAHAVRVSSLRNISLRHNKINATGAVAIALMIRDYPDRFPITNGTISPSLTSPSASTTNLVSPPQTPVLSQSPQLPVHPPTPPPRSGPILPPPRHPSSIPQTTYTPYIPRAKRAAAAAAMVSITNPLSPSGQQIPMITSSAQGGITTRHPVPSTPPPSTNGHHGHGQSAALLDKVRALDSLPRLGALKTLDLRGNDIRSGITYVAQVLKRNRTLKVLNLCENKLDVQGLVAIAEALKYNSCLETLDLSKNPCCGPNLEGVQSLRTAFTLNNALKRLFLSSTSLTPAAAIALAEFLPESTSLLHLDLTLNNLDLAGVMALSQGLKANHTMRCLDLNIPPGDEEMARMCREILNTCVRNTEDAEKAAHPAHNDAPSGRGQGKGVWVMIEESELAKTFRQDEQKKVEVPVSDADSPLALEEDHADQALSLLPTEQKDADVLAQAHSCKAELDDLLSRSPSSSTSPVLRPGEFTPDMEKRVRGVLKVLGQLIDATEDPARLEELLGLNDDITASLSRFSFPGGGWTRTGLGIRIDVGKAQQGVVPDGHDAADSDDQLLTPRIDKGKGRAEPEPEKPELVLSPRIEGPEDAEGEEGEGEVAVPAENVVSPTDLSRSWVAEEGEIFRKGTVLLTPEDMEGEYDSEELRKELLEAMVERPPPRALNDGLDELGPVSPVSPITSPVEQKKQLPRPYIRRSRSSSSDVSAIDSPKSPSAPPPFREAV